MVEILAGILVAWIVIVLAIFIISNIIAPFMPENHPPEIKQEESSSDSQDL